MNKFFSFSEVLGAIMKSVCGISWPLILKVRPFRSTRFIFFSFLIAGFLSRSLSSKNSGVNLLHILNGYVYHTTIFFAGSIPYNCVPRNTIVY